MKSNFFIFGALALAGAPALGQPPAAPAPPPPGAAPTGPQAALQQAATAFSHCISAGIQNVDAAATPEAGAAGVMSGCAAQRQQLDQAVDGMIATAPQDQQAAAHAQYQSQIGDAQAQIAAAIRQQRAAPAAPPTPATPATPPPH